MDWVFFLKFLCFRRSFVAINADEYLWFNSFSFDVDTQRTDGHIVIVWNCCSWIFLCWYCVDIYVVMPSSLLIHNCPWFFEMNEINVFFFFSFSHLKLKKGKKKSIKIAFFLLIYRWVVNSEHCVNNSDNFELQWTSEFHLGTYT